jgi:crossover junction endodeoxyribonuclease RuvC
MNYYVGLDLSYTGTGLFIIDECGKVVVEREIASDACQFVNDIQRSDWIAHEIVNTLKDYAVSMIVVEDYFSGGSNSQVGLRLAVLGSIVRLRLLQNGHSFITIANSQNKKFVTGSGSSNKDQIQMFVLKKYNIVSLSNNTADACGMAHVAKAYHQFTSGLATKDSFVKYEWEVIKKMTKDSVITTPYTLEGIEPKKIKKKKSL